MYTWYTYKTMQDAAWFDNIYLCCFSRLVLATIQQQRLRSVWQ